MTLILIWRKIIVGKIWGVKKIARINITKNTDIYISISPPCAVILKLQICFPHVIHYMAVFYAQSFDVSTFCCCFIVCSCIMWKKYVRKNYPCSPKKEILHLTKELLNTTTNINILYFTGCLFRGLYSSLPTTIWIVFIACELQPQVANSYRQGCKDIKIWKYKNMEVWIYEYKI